MTIIIFICTAAFIFFHKWKTNAIKKRMSQFLLDGSTSKKVFVKYDYDSIWARIYLKAQLPSEKEAPVLYEDPDFQAFIKRIRLFEILLPSLVILSWVAQIIVA